MSLELAGANILAYLAPFRENESMTADLLEKVRHLPKLERLRFWDAMWSNLVEDGLVPDLTAEQSAELQRRIEDDARHPDDAVSWDEVKAELKARRGWEL